MQRSCSKCSSTFTLLSSERDLLQRLSPSIQSRTFTLPYPTLCPACRFQRRLNFRHETALYRRKCDLSGKDIISAISADKPYKVYNPIDYWSDRWDPLAYGRQFDFNAEFFPQVNDLRLVVPHISLLVDARNENSDFVNQANEVRNCYLICGGVNDEDCYYCYRVFNSKNCVDCSFIAACELCYQCFDCSACYHGLFLEKCSNCFDCSYLFDCHGCNDCFFSSNLRNKQYYFLNQPCTKDEYLSKLQAYDFTRSSVLERVRADYLKSRPLFHHRAVHHINCEGSSGDDLTNCKEAELCFNCNELDHCTHCFLLFDAKNCADLSYGWGNNEWCYEGATIGENSYNAQFCSDSWNIQNCYYCDTCINCKDCFACIGLNTKRHCILNTQYSPEQYEQLLVLIFEHLTRSKEYGEMFPIADAVICYNESPAQLYFPLTREQALQAGYKWKERDNKEYLASSVALPDRLSEVTDSVLKEVLSCSRCNKNYRLVAKELSFYRSQQLGLPRQCIDCRRDMRFALRNPRALWPATCSICKRETLTSLPQGKRDGLLCTECYLDKVY